MMSRYDALLNRPEVHFQHRYEARRTRFSPAGHGYLQATKMSLSIVNCRCFLILDMSKSLVSTRIQIAVQECI